MCTMGKKFSAVNGLLLLFVLFFIVSCSDMMDSYGPTGQEEEIIRTTADEWIQVDNTGFPVGEYIYGVSYGNGRFVAFGYNSLAYSSDGKTWIHPAGQWYESETLMFADAVNGNGVWIVVAAGYPNVGRSTDNAVSWDEIPTPFTRQIYGVSYHNDVFVAVAYDGQIAYSEDKGLSWTRVDPTPLGNDYLYDVAYGNDRFVAVGTNTIGYNSGDYANSNDWLSAQSIPGYYSSGIFRTVAYGNGLFITGYGEAITYSSDGNNWQLESTMPTSFDGVGGPYAVTFGAGLYVAVGASNTIVYSVDADIWIRASDPGFSDAVNPNILGVAYGNGIFVATGRDGKIAYSVR